MNWQPIKTAPRDVFVLVYVQGWNPFNNDIEFAQRYADGIWETSDGHCGMNPTHWMPMPPAPTKEPT